MQAYSALAQRMASEIVREVGQTTNLFASDYGSRPIPKFDRIGDSTFWTLDAGTNPSEGIPAAECAIATISSLLAASPKFVAGPDTDVPIAHPANDLLARPSRILDPRLWWERYCRDLVAGGNAYALLRRDRSRESGPPIEMLYGEWKTTSTSGSPRGQNGMRIRHQLSLNIAGYSKEVSANSADVVSCHGPGFVPKDYRSPSPLRGAALRVIDTMLAAYSMGQSSLRRGTHTGSVIELSDTVMEGIDPANIAQRMEQIRAFIVENFAGAERSGKTPVLPAGATVSRQGLSAVDLQLIELLKFSIEDIARIFNFPVRLLHHFHGGQRISEGTYQAQGADFDRYTLRPHAGRLQSAFGWALLNPMEQQAGLRILCDTSRVAEGTLTEEIEALGRAAANFGIMMPNEARERLGLPDHPEGGRLLQPKGAPTQGERPPMEDS